MTSAHRAKVEEKPEVRKAGGVYYTPRYIVNYIVENTFGVQLQNKTPKTLKNFRIVDPACGSGSFLINAYQYLLDWYLREYMKSPEQYKKQCIKTGERGGNGVYKLTIGERKRILTCHIFGVDIDAQAVEVTKLSLLLKALEGLNEQEIQKELFNERVLPDLSRNIKCGNSLIGTDFYIQGTLGLSEDEQYKVNAFDWETEFADVFKDGGFDAVIGNPPYVLMQTINSEIQFSYLSNHYKTATYKIDTYQVFIEKAVTISKMNGYFGFITPNSFLRNKFSVNLRNILLYQTKIKRICLFYYSVFAAASVDTLIICAQKAEDMTFDDAVEITKWMEKGVQSAVIRCSQRAWLKNQNFEIEVIESQEKAVIIDKIINTSRPFGTYGTAYFGIQTHDREKYVSVECKSKHWKPVIDGKNIHNWFMDKSFEFVCCEKEAIKSGGKDDVYQKERICTRQIGITPVATIVPQGIYTLNTIYNLYFDKQTEYSLKFVLGIMMSTAFKFFWKAKYFDEKMTFPKVKKDALLDIPIPVLDFSKKSDKAQHDKLVALVDQMLVLKKKEHAETVPQTKTMLGRQIQAVNKQIDTLVYELYGLTEDEIKVVEGEG
jgi:hypothetical protein